MWINVSKISTVQVIKKFVLVWTCGFFFNITKFHASLIRLNLLSFFCLSTTICSLVYQTKISGIRAMLIEGMKLLLSERTLGQANI